MELNKPDLIKVLITDSSEIFLMGLLRLFEDYPFISVLEKTSSFDETFSLNNQLKPDLILLSYKLNSNYAIEKIPDLLLCNPSVKVLILNHCTENTNFTFRALRMGVMGVFSIENSAQLLISAIKKVFSGEIWLESMSSKSFFIQSYTKNELMNDLTPRERDIVCLAAKGLSAKEIGEMVFITERTVRNQLTSIYAKLQVKNQVSLCINYGNYNFCDNFNCIKKDKCSENK